MSNVQNAGQNVKGKVQQVVGAVEKKMGHPVQGNMDELKGKANVAVSNLKSEVQKAK